MNTSQETLASLGQPINSGPDSVTRAALIEAQSIPRDDIAKSVASSRLQPAGYPNTLGGMTPLSEATLKALESLGLSEFASMAKSITTGTGLVAYDLQAPAKNLYPFYAPIRNFLPRVAGGVGTATNWRQVNAIIGSGYDNIAWVPEGQRSGRMQYNTSSRSASYVTIGEEDAITYEAINAARTFEDLQATMVFRLLQKMMLKEEMALLGGNATNPVAAPGTPTAGTVTVAGANVQALTYYAQCAALTIEGWNNAVRTAPMTAPTSITVTGADSQTYVVNGGTGPISGISAGQAASGTTCPTFTVAPVPGAVAYAWYIGSTNSAGANRLQAITTTNSVVWTGAALSTTSQLASAISADFSTNPNYGFDGLLTTALKPGSNAYINNLPTGTAGTGTFLTPSGRGSVVEIDNMLRSMWDQFQLSPTILFVNSQELTNITNKVLTGPGASPGPLLRYDLPADGSDYQNFIAGGVISQYYNPYAPPDAGMRIPVRIHPKVPPGTILGWAQNLPVQYQSNEVPNVAEVKTRQDYYQIDWPIVTRQRAVGVYAEEVLAVYAC